MMIDKGVALIAVFLFLLILNTIGTMTWINIYKQTREKWGIPFIFLCGIATIVFAVKLIQMLGA